MKYDHELMREILSVAVQPAVDEICKELQSTIDPDSFSKGFVSGLLFMLDEERADPVMAIAKVMQRETVA